MSVIMKRESVERVALAVDALRFERVPPAGWRDTLAGLEYVPNSVPSRLMDALVAEHDRADALAAKLAVAERDLAEAREAVATKDRAHGRSIDREHLLRDALDAAKAVRDGLMLTAQGNRVSWAAVTEGDMCRYLRAFDAAVAACESPVIAGPAVTGDGGCKRCGGTGTMLSADFDSATSVVPCSACSPSDGALHNGGSGGAALHNGKKCAECHGTGCCDSGGHEWTVGCIACDTCHGTGKEPT